MQPSPLHALLLSTFILTITCLQVQQPPNLQLPDDEQYLTTLLYFGITQFENITGEIVIGEPESGCSNWENQKERVKGKIVLMKPASGCSPGMNTSQIHITITLFSSGLVVIT